MAKPIIELTNISKKYALGKKQHYYSLRDTLVGIVKSPIRLLQSRKSNSNSLYNNEFLALKDVSFSINPGEVVGIIGSNGAGKSTLLKILSRITPPTSGEIVLRGRVASLLEVGTGFHQELTGRENIFLNGSILGMKRWEIKKKFHEIVEFAGIEKFLDTPVKHYSSGMYMRLAFSVAAHLEPEILLVDEVLAVGDAVFQKKSLDKMKDVSTKEGRTVLLVSHNLLAIQRLCQRVILFDHGSVVADGTPDKVISKYLGPGKLQKVERIWESKTNAPGDDTIRLKSVRVLDKLNKPISQVDITQPIKIEIQYWNLKNGSIPSAGIYLKTPDGLPVLTSFDFHNSRWGNKPKPVGVYKSICHIPGNFLAEGSYLFSPVIDSLFIGTSICHADCEAINFEVVDHMKRSGTRGDYKGFWPGMIRPKLEWQITHKD